MKLINNPFATYGHEGAEPKLPNEIAPNSRTAESSMTKEETQPTDFSAIAPPLCNTFRFLLIWSRSWRRLV